MIQEVEKQPKVALCRKCRGTGIEREPIQGRNGYVTNAAELGV